MAARVRPSIAAYNHSTRVAVVVPFVLRYDLCSLDAPQSLSALVPLD